MLRIIQKLTKSTLFKSTGTYTVANIIRAFIPLLLLPILTKYLSPADFGRVAIFQVTIALTLPLINLNTHGAITRRFFDKNIHFASYLSNCLFIAVLTTLLFSLLFLLSISILKSFLPLSLTLISSIPLICLFQFLSNLPLYVWQVEIKPFKYSIFSISQSIINVSATLLFVVFLGHGWEGRVNAVILTYIIFSFIGLIILVDKNLILFRINGDYIKRLPGFICQTTLSPIILE